MNLLMDLKELKGLYKANMKLSAKTFFTYSKKEIVEIEVKNGARILLKGGDVILLKDINPLNIGVEFD